MTAAPPIILGVETACDDCSVAMLSGGDVLSNIVVTESNAHAQFGGIVPEIAARQQLQFIGAVFQQACDAAGVTTDQIDLVAVNNKHGLVRSVTVGTAFANGLACALGKPLISVHHVEAHVLSPLIGLRETAPKSVCLAVAGGHNLLIKVEGLGDYRIIGRTIDDCAGEAFDKTAMELGLGFPGGPAIDRLAAEGDPNAFDFPRPMLRSKDLDFSFSGLKTAVRTVIQRMAPEERTANKADLAASFQQAVVDVFVAKSLRALTEQSAETLLVAGGVAANSQLRSVLTAEAETHGFQLLLAERKYCGDNAAMTAFAGYLHHKAGTAETGFVEAVPQSPLGAHAEKY